MNAIILNGYQLAEQHLAALKPRIKKLLNQGKNPVIAAVLFREDTGSVLYTDLKREMAESLGIGYQIHEYSLKNDVSQVVEQIKQLNRDSAITGIIVQKPWRTLWINTQELGLEEGKDQFTQWWKQLTTTIDPTKDVDGLHPSTLAAIRNDTWQKEGRVLPATCKAVLALLESAFETENLLPVLKQLRLKVVILGKSDLLGQPLFALLQSKNILSEIIGSSELKQRIEQGIALADADVIVSATGRRKLVTGEMIKAGAIVIDVGEPQGDVDFASVTTKAKALSPVPGGVGPMTVVSLMENAVELM